MKKMKNLKALWAKMFHRPILLVVNTDKSNCLHVLELNNDPEGNSLTDGLGITEKRKDELVKAINLAFVTSDNLVQAAAVVSKECAHANELFFVSCVLTHRMRDQNENPHALIMKMLMGREKK